MKKVDIHEAKTHLSRLIRDAERGEEVIIARAGKPVVRLLPVETQSRVRTLGAFAGQIVIHDDFEDSGIWVSLRQVDVSSSAVVASSQSSPSAICNPGKSPSSSVSFSATAAAS